MSDYYEMKLGDAEDFIKDLEVQVKELQQTANDYYCKMTEMAGTIAGLESDNDDLNYWREQWRLVGGKANLRELINRVATLTEALEKIEMFANLDPNENPSQGLYSNLRDIAREALKQTRGELTSNGGGDE